MTRDTKTLTVSYGSFSCTLEGYEDPVPTLQAIGAHFSHLSQQNHSFGAPPLAHDTNLAPSSAQADARTLQPNSLQTDAPEHDDPKHCAPENDTRPDANFEVSLQQAKKLQQQTTDIQSSAPYVLPASALTPTPLSAADRLQRLRAAAAQLQAPRDVSPAEFAQDQTVDDFFNPHPAQENEAHRSIRAVAAPEPPDFPTQPQPIDRAEHLRRVHARAADFRRKSSARINTASVLAQNDEISATRVTPSGEPNPALSISSKSTNTPQQHKKLQSSGMAVQRLLETTEREMNSGANARRRDTFQHLKAAVFATRSERNRPSQDDHIQNAIYKDDLDTAIHATTPPLRLVAHQRIKSPS